MTVEEPSGLPPQTTPQAKRNAMTVPQAQKSMNLGWAFLVAVSALLALPPNSIEEWVNVLAVPALALGWLLQRQTLHFAQWFPIYMTARVAATLADDLRSGNPLDRINLFFLVVTVSLTVYVFSPAGRKAVRSAG